MTKLSICVPSHGDFSGSKQTLDNLYDLSRLKNIECVVSDNSSDSFKSDFWLSRGDASFEYIISRNNDAQDNWRCALSHANSDYTVVLSDDDMLHTLPGFDLEKIKIPKGSIGFRPAMALYHESVGIYRLNNFEITDSRAIDRVKAYLKNNGGANTTLFSAYETQLLKSIFNVTLKEHPTKGGYMDWAIVLGLISTGPLLKCPELLYVYNNRNWFAKEDTDRNVCKTFTDVGMPGDCSQILPALQALDSFIFITRVQSPVEPDEKLEAANFIVYTYFASLIKLFGTDGLPFGFDPERWIKVRSILRSTVTPLDRLAASLLIIDIWIPGLSDLYRSYMDDQVDPVVLKAIFNTQEI